MPNQPIDLAQVSMQLILTSVKEREVKLRLLKNKSTMGYTMCMPMAMVMPWPGRGAFALKETIF